LKLGFEVSVCCGLLFLLLLFEAGEVEVKVKVRVESAFAINFLFL
jgi:hypothetical protein